MNLMPRHPTHVRPFYRHFVPQTDLPMCRHAGTSDLTIPGTEANNPILCCRYLNPATGDDSVPAVCTCSRGSRRASRCGRGSPLNRDEGSTGAASKRTIELGAARVASVCDRKHNRVQLPRAIKGLTLQARQVRVLTVLPCECVIARSRFRAGLCQP